MSDIIYNKVISYTKKQLEWSSIRRKLRARMKVGETRDIIDATGIKMRTLQMYGYNKTEPSYSNGIAIVKYLQDNPIINPTRKPRAKPVKKLTTETTYQEMVRKGEINGIE